MGADVRGDGTSDRPGASRGEEPQKNVSVRFSISKRKQVHTVGISAKKDVDEAVEFVSSVDANGIQIVGGSVRTDVGTRVIPRLEDTWKPEKRMKNLVRSDDEAKEFVSEVLPAGPVNGVHYGLSLRVSESGASVSDSQVQKDVLAARELKAKLDKQVLDEHLSTLPEPASSEDYEQTPVEGFGQAMMRGMGWIPGAGIGRRATADIVPTQYVSRPSRLGLGATPAPKEEPKKKHIKPGETREKQPDLVAPVGPDGQIRSRISLDEKPVERVKKGVYGGKVMSIIAGKHAGLRGEVVGKKDRAAVPGERVIVKLKSGEAVSVDAGELADVGSLDEERAMNRLKELRLNVENGGKKQEESSRMEIDEEKRRPWLRNQIRVRIVSKSFEKGRLYLKKGRVVDVVAPTLCDVLLDDDGKLYQRVKQEYLETVVPKSGGTVVVVDGEHKGCIGRLLSKDREAETATVQMEESFEMVTLSLDSIAEFVRESG